MALDWKHDQPPLVPIYFCDTAHLEETCESLDMDILSMILDYYVYFEKFEKAAIVKKVIDSRGNVSLDLDDIKTQKDFQIQHLIPGSPQEVIEEDYEDDDDDESGIIIFD